MRNIFRPENHIETAAAVLATVPYGVYKAGKAAYDHFSRSEPQAPNAEPDGPEQPGNEAQAS